MSSTVTCGYSGAAWEVNSAGQNACQQYAALVGTCDPTFVVSDVTVSSPPYTPSAASAPCACNVVAYNLQAACAWCQSAIQPSWWLLESQWSGNCTLLSATYNGVSLPASVPTASLNIPSWATATVNTLDETWNPTRASQLAVAVAATGVATTGAATAAVPTGNGGFGGVTTGYNNPYTTYNPYSTYDPYNYGGYNYGSYTAAATAGVAIYIGVVIGIWALHFIIMGIVYYLRQKRRQAWYRPMAQFYQSGGAPGGMIAAPLLFHNEPNAQGSPHTGHTSLPPVGHSPSPSNAYTAYQPPPPSNIPLNNHNNNNNGGYNPSNPGAFVPPGYNPNTDNRMSYAPPPSAAGTQGGGYMTAGGQGGHEYPPNTPGTNPFNTPYGTPGPHPQGPPPGAGGAAGYTGHAEVY